MSKSTSKQSKGIREILRKLLVSLKRRPQIIPLIALACAFLVYSLNLTAISNTTAKIQGPQMGLCGFVAMLFSILSFVTFLNAFPKRKKANVPMLVLMYVMFGIIILSDLIYYSRITNALTRTDNPITVTENTLYILEAQNIVIVHVVLIGLVAALIALLPVYGKLIKKINTSVEVEDNGSLDVIDISGEE